MLQTSFHKETLLCPHCSSEETVTIWDIVEATDDPDLRDRLLEKRLQVLDCSNCGRHYILDTPLLYRDARRGFSLYVHSALSALTHTRSMQDQVALLDLDIPSGAEEDRLRICGSYNELLEKIHIFEAGLDDRMIECYKILRFFQYKWTWKREIAESRFIGLRGSQLLFYERLQPLDPSSSVNLRGAADGSAEENEEERMFELDRDQYDGLERALNHCIETDEDTGWRCVSNALGHEWLLTLDLFRDPGQLHRAEE